MSTEVPCCSAAFGTIRTLSVEPAHEAMVARSRRGRISNTRPSRRTSPIYRPARHPPSASRCRTGSGLAAAQDGAAGIVSSSGD